MVEVGQGGVRSAAVLVIAQRFGFVLNPHFVPVLTFAVSSDPFGPPTHLYSLIVGFWPPFVNAAASSVSPLV